MTESEFLARRESVDRVMVVRSKFDRIQIAVLEDGVLVEHYVAKAQDATLQVNADKIADSRDLARKIAEMDPNSTVDVKVWRNNAEQTMKVKLGLFPKNAEAAMRGDSEGNDNNNGPAAKPASVELSQLGLTLMPARSGDTDGVVIAEVDPASDAAQKGLKSGDVILEVSGQLVAKPDDVVAGVKKAQNLKRTAVLLHVKSADQKRFVAVQLKDSKG